MSTMIAIEYRAYDLTPVESYLKYGISNEGFRDGIAFIKDLVGHSFRTVKVNVKNFKKDYVQSDFQQFHSANRSRLNLFLKNPSRKLVKDTFLPMPDGMTATYPVAMNTLAPFVSLPFGEIIKTLNTVSEGITKLINSKMDDATKVKMIESKIKAGNFLPVIKATHDLSDRLPKMFVKGRVTSSTVGAQFKDKKEVILIIDQLLTCGSRFKEFLKHQNDVNKVESNFKKLTDAAVRYERTLNSSQKKAFSTVLYAFVKEIAVFCDYYGVAINEVLRIENKFMLCLKQMMEAAK